MKKTKRLLAGLMVALMSVTMLFTGIPAYAGQESGSTPASVINDASGQASETPPSTLPPSSQNAASSGTPAASSGPGSSQQQSAPPAAGASSAAGSSSTAASSTPALIPPPAASEAPEATPEVVSFRVRFYDWDSTLLIPEQLIESGADAVPPANPQREGYSFSGWSPSYQNIMGDTNIYAQYTALTTYTVTINYIFANNTIAAQPYILTLDSGSNYNQTVPSPNITGYSPSHASIPLVYTSISQSYTYTVTYTPATNTPYKVEHYQQNINLDTPLSSYALIGADTQSLMGQTGAVVQAVAKVYNGFTPPTPLPSAQISGDGSTVIRVYYTRNQSAIYFNTSGGTYIAPIAGAFGTAVAAPANPTRLGYLFAGWNTAVPATIPAADVTLTASWTPTTGTSYKVVYWLENISATGYDYVGADNATGTTGAAPVVPGAPTVTFPIAATYYSINSTKTNAEKPAAISGDGSTILNVYYTRNSYTLTFNFNATKYSLTVGSTTYNTSPYTLTAKYGAAINSMWPGAPVLRTGQTSEGAFVGWNGGSIQYVTTQFFLDTNLLNNNPFNALWNANSKNVTVYYYFANLTGGGETANYTQTVAIDPSSSTWNAKSFTGFTVVNSNVAIVNNTATFHYTRNNYSITYYNGGNIDTTLNTGAIPYQTSLASGYSYTPPRPASVPTGYVFNGWYTTAQGLTGTQFVFTGATMPAYNLILYARWDKPQYTVLFNPDNSNPTFAQTVYALDTLTAPTPPTKAGYVFGGWYNLPSTLRYMFSFPVNSAFTLTARWIPANNITYDVVYMIGSTEYQRNTFGGKSIGDSVTGTAISIPGYLPDALSKSLLIAATGNVITFNYTAFTNKAYTVNYLDASNGNAPLQAPKNATSPQAVITENFVNFPGYYPDFYQKTLQLSVNPASNVINFYYTKNALANYTVRVYMEEVTGGYTFTDTIKQLPIGSTATEIPATFTGFTYMPGLSSNGRVVASNGSTILRLYYNRNQFTITFAVGANGSLGGQTTFAGIRYETPFGSATTTPTLIPAPGFKFDVWTPTLPAASALVLADATYTASFIKDPTQYGILTYNANGGTGATPPSPETLIGTTYTLAANGFLYTDHTFTGWNTQADGDGTDYAAGDSIPFPGSIILYAQWVENSKFAVTYLPNGGTGSVATLSYFENNSVTVAANTFVYPGFMFVEWRDQNSVAYNPAGTFNITQNMLLYAQWEYDPSQHGTVHFEPNNPDTTGTMPDASFLVGTQTLPANGFTLTNYTFTGWTAAQNGSGTLYPDMGSFPVVAGTQTLYAQWTENPKFNIVYNANNTTPDTLTNGPFYINTSNTLAPANTFSYLHYDFMRWNTQADGLGTTYLPGSSYLFPGSTSADLVLYAIWKERGHFDVLYANGYSADPPIEIDDENPHYVNELGTDTVIVKDNPFVRIGYTFVDWLSVANVHVPEDAVLPGMEHDLLFTAVWTPKIYSIAYVLEGGSLNGTNPSNYTIETNTFDLINPTKPGYTFTGWTGIGLETPDTSETVPLGTTGDLTFTAHWEQDPAQWSTITFVSDNPTAGTLSGPVSFYGIKGLTTTPPTITTYPAVVQPQPQPTTGYHFKNWSAPIPAAYPNEDITIIAYWEYIPVVVSGPVISSSQAPASSSGKAASSKPVSSSSGKPASSISSAPVSAPQSQGNGGITSAPTSAATSRRIVASASASASGSGSAANSASARSGSTVSSMEESAGSAAPIISQASAPSQPTPANGNGWALVNLLLAVFGGVAAILLFIMIFGRRKESGPLPQKAKNYRLATILLGILAVVLFFLTEDLTNTMRWVDMWTIVAALVAAVQIVLLVLYNRAKHPKNPQNNTPPTNTAP